MNRHRQTDKTVQILWMFVGDMTMFHILRLMPSSSQPQLQLQLKKEQIECMAAWISNQPFLYLWWLDGQCRKHKRLYWRERECGQDQWNSPGKKKTNSSQLFANTHGPLSLKQRYFHSKARQLMVPRWTSQLRQQQNRWSYCIVGPKMTGPYSCLKCCKVCQCHHPPISFESSICCFQKDRWTFHPSGFCNLSICFIVYHKVSYRLGS